VTTRGMGEGEMRQIADWVADVLAGPADRSGITRVRASVLELCQAFPLYPELVSAE